MCFDRFRPVSWCAALSQNSDRLDSSVNRLICEIYENQKECTGTHPVLLDELVLLAEGPDGDEACQGLVEVLEDGRECHTVEALQFACAGNVQLL